MRCDGAVLSAWRETGTGDWFRVIARSWSRRYQGPEHRSRASRSRPDTFGVLVVSRPTVHPNINEARPAAIQLITVHSAAGRVDDVGPHIHKGMPMSTDTVTGDVVDVLLAQHQQVKDLLGAVAAGGSGIETSFCELRRAIAVHETAEEEIVYPVLRSTDDEGRRIADDRTGEEIEGIKVLAELEAMTTGSPEFMELFTKFHAAVLEHAGHEEQTVVPFLRKTQDAGTLQSMAKAFEVAENAAPTHPHPHIPTSVPGDLAPGPALAIMDRVRDALHGS